MRGERKRRTSGGNALIFGLDFTFHAPAALSRPPYPVTATLVSIHAPDFSVMHPPRTDASIRSGRASALRPRLPASGGRPLSGVGSGGNDYVTNPRAPEITTQTSGIIAQDSEIVAQTSEIVAQTSGIVAQASGIVAQASGIVAQASGIVAQASGIVAQGSGIVAQASGIVADAPGVIAQKPGIIAQPRGTSAPSVKITVPIHSNPSLRIFSDFSLALTPDGG